MDSPADDIGFKAGDVLVTIRVNDAFFGPRKMVLRSVNDLADRLRTNAGSEVEVFALREDRTLSANLYVRRH